MSNLTSVFKCPMCGSHEGRQEGERIKCAYCGVVFKVKHENEQAFNELDHAYNAMLDTQFSNALSKYNKIIQDYKNDSDILEYAYYGQFLCEQRVLLYRRDDGVTIPSFWDISRTACQKSKNFQEALENAKKNESLNTDNYKKQAERIEDYKKKYENVARQGRQYDVFICFKNTEESRNLGYELYHELRNEGYKVFFSPESLKGTGGQDYEPYIYDALQKAKVMLVLCSTEEELNSSWVKNEWWRFSHLAKGNPDRLIVPILMKDFEASRLPDEIGLDQHGAQRQYEEGYGFRVIDNVVASVKTHMESVGQKGRKTEIKNSFDYELDDVRRDWNGQAKDEARKEIDKLIQDKTQVNEDHPENYIKAYVLKARINSNEYKDIRNEAANKAIELAQSMAKNHDLVSVLKDNSEYRNFCAAKRKKVMCKALIVALVVAFVAAGGVGVYQLMQDPVVDAYITGNPVSVELEYGEGLLSELSSVTTVSKKGHEKEVELTSSMISGFDPTKIGVQDVVIRYEDFELHLSVNVMRYTLSSPVELKFENGQIIWEGIQKAQSYTLRINDEVIENVQATSYRDLDFTEAGLYTIQVKAMADTNVGMDSAYTEAFTVVKLAQASNLKREGMQLTWDAVPDCNSYDVYINDQKAVRVATTSHTLTWDQLATGDNLIYVIPVDGSNIKSKAEISEEELLHYDHNGEITVDAVQLERVSGLKREGLVLSWDEVPGCSSYDIYVNGEYATESEGTSYTLTAELLAKGENQIRILPTDARNIKLREDLSEEERRAPDQIGQLTVYRYQQTPGLLWKNSKLSWTAVEGAGHYSVYVNDELVGRTEQTSYELDGKLEAGSNKVYVLTEDVPYISGSGGTDYENNSTIYVEKLLPATGLAISNKKLTWAAVEGATEYRVYCNGELVSTVKTPSYDVVIDNTQAKRDTYTVQACGATGVLPSELSETVTVGCLPAPQDIKVEEDSLFWSAVNDATGYQIYAGDSLLCEVNADVRSLKLLGKLEKGDYKLSVVAKGSGDSLLSSGRSQTVDYTVAKTIIYITTEEELRNIVLKLDQTYFLGNDITLTGDWTPLGTTSSPFKGSFDGNGHTISGLRVTADSGRGIGLFGIVAKDAVIENLTIKDAAITITGSSGSSAGIVVGENKGTVRNVTTYGTISAPNSDRIGGIVGSNSDYGQVYNCTNHAAVTGKRYVGGIVGHCTIAQFDRNFDACGNDGEVQGNQYVGGSIGYVEVKQKTTFREIRNEGKVTATDKYAGGVFGYIKGNAGQTGTLVGCSNSGDITAGDYAAGCACTGNYITVTTGDIANTENNCTNTGTVTAKSGEHSNEIES